MLRKMDCFAALAMTTTAKREQRAVLGPLFSKSGCLLHAERIGFSFTHSTYSGVGLCIHLGAAQGLRYQAPTAAASVEAAALGKV